MESELPYCAPKPAMLRYQVSVYLLGDISADDCRRVPLPLCHLLKFCLRTRIYFPTCKPTLGA
jgi:hypothetical protein